MSAPKLPYNTVEEKQHVHSLQAQLDPAHSWQVQITKIGNTRTTKQNASLHKYLTSLAEGLNEGGYTFKVVLNQPAHAACKAFDVAVCKMPIPAKIKATIIGWVDHVIEKLDYADCDWTMELAKEFLWRPIQLATTQKESSTDLTTVEIQDVYMQLNRATTENFGISYAWPSIESMSEEQKLCPKSRGY